MKIERDFVYDPSLVLYLPFWELDGAKFQSKDAYGHLCTNLGAVRSFNGLNFDGVDDGIIIPNSPSLNITGTKLTIEAWVKFTAFSNWARVIAKETAGTAVQYRVLLDDAQRIFLSIYVGYNIDSPKSPVLSLGAWYHVAGVYTGGNILFYTNGIGASSGTWNDSIVASAENVYLGREGSGSFAACSLALVRIYNRALNANEIQRLYMMDKWRFQ